MSFTQLLFEETHDTWQKEISHPFIEGIGTSSLPLKIFRYYMQQDYVFLIDFCRTISLAVAKANKLEDMGWFAKLLDETINTEMSLHVSFSNEFNISEEELNNTAPSPTTHGYTSHLLQTAFTGGVGEIASSILPCCWGYSEIGRILSQNYPSIDQPLYSKWVEMYSSEEFRQLANWLITFIDRIALTSGEIEMELMKKAFILSAKYEYMFWDAAYKMERWQI